MEIFPPILKKKGKKTEKGKEKVSYICIVYITFNITGGGLLVFFDDELTAFRNKNFRLFIYV